MLPKKGNLENKFKSAALLSADAHYIHSALPNIPVSLSAAGRMAGHDRPNRGKVISYLKCPTD